MKILIVEDNYAMRHLIRSVLSDMAEVLECGDGADALAFYEQHRPDWVLMDIRMQNVSGIEATRQIIAAYSDARVIIVTNYNDERLREAGRTAGACDYVLKEDLTSLRRILTAPTERAQ
ncbi:MAG TPA: response regulator transcription factor [Blastocatellia bacterium]|jgi:CheY-like chemotaxis protein